MTQPEIEILGVETCNKSGPYGDSDPYAEHLAVEVDGEREEIPITGVSTTAYDYYSFPEYDGELPDTVDFEEVFLYWENLHGWMWLGENKGIELVFDSEWSSGTWSLHYTHDPITDEGTVIWER